MKRSFYIFFLSIVIISCDKIDDPFPKDLGNSISLDGDTEYITDPSLNISTPEQLLELLNTNTWDSLSGPNNSNQRFIVLEEFTGHTCINCYLGTNEVIRLDSIHKEKLIPIAIHAGNFAEPKTTGDKYRTDHRDKDRYGETYSSTFNSGNAYPRGMVSRLGGDATEVNNWQKQIESIIDDQPAASIAIKNYYSSPSNLLRIDVQIKWSQNLQDDFNLQVMVVEDHIIDWQKVLAQDVENYEHRHVLRKVVNSTWGKTLLPAQVDSTQKIQYILPLDPSWKANDLESVAFIFNNDVSSYEVIQANAAHVSE